MAEAAREPPSARWRIPVTAVAVFGLGTLVALAAGIVLWLGLGSAAESTQELVQARADATLDTLERGLRDRLEPVAEQARWVAALVAEGTLALTDPARLDDFMLGALAATPRVAGIGFFRPDGTGRIWYRDARLAVREDRSTDPDLQAWLEAGEQTGNPAWGDPLWVDTLDATAVFHSAPLRREGRFLGMFGQIVPVSDLSRELVQDTPPGATAFVLHRERQVIAHPQLIHWSPPDAGEEKPLASVTEIGDPVLAALGTEATREGRWLVRPGPDLEVAWVVLEDIWHLVLQRRVPRYGDWMIGVHIDTREDGERPIERTLMAAGAGLAVLVLAVLAAVFVGDRISRPVRSIAAAARVVEGGRLDEARPLRPSWIREMDDANRSFNRMVEGLRERRLIRRTLGRYVPERVAHALLSAGGSIEPVEVRASVLFCDLAGFTSLTEALGPASIVAVLNDWFSRMTGILERRGGTVIQFQGDAILATFNVPVADPGYAHQAVRAALEMRAATREMRAAGRALQCRIGIGTGKVIAGAVGAAGRLSYTVYGDAVNLAARLESLNRERGTGILLCGETAAGAAGLPVEPVGTVTVRGQSAATELFTVPLSGEPLEEPRHERNRTHPGTGTPGPGEPLLSRRAGG